MRCWKVFNLFESFTRIQQRQIAIEISPVDLVAQLKRNQPHGTLGDSGDNIFKKRLQALEVQIGKAVTAAEPVIAWPLSSAFPDNPLSDRDLDKDRDIVGGGVIKNIEHGL